MCCQRCLWNGRNDMQQWDVKWIVPSLPSLKWNLFIPMCCVEIPLYSALQNRLIYKPLIPKQSSFFDSSIDAVPLFLLSSSKVTQRVMLLLLCFLLRRRISLTKIADYISKARQLTDRHSMHTHLVRWTLAVTHRGVGMCVCGGGRGRQQTAGCCLTDKRWNTWQCNCNEGITWHPLGYDACISLIFPEYF